MRSLAPRLLIALALVLGVCAPAAADDLDDARRAREEARRRRAEAAAQLDTLEATDRDLEEAAAALADQLRAQGRELADAQRRQAAAEAEVVEASRRVQEVGAEIELLRLAVQERAVDAYVHAGTGNMATLLASGDLDEVARKGSYLQHATQRDHDLLDRLGAAREDRAAEEDHARDAAARAEDEREKAEGALERLETTRAEQVRVQRALEVRIDEFTAEVDALAAQEKKLASLISRYEEQKRAAERRRRAAEEKARREAAARAAAARERAVPLPPPAVVDRAPQAPAPPSASSPAGLIWPVSGPVTSGFGYRWGRLHQGIDIGAGTGTPIRAAKAGVVIYAGWMNGYGNVVLLDNGGSLVTLYAHQSRLGSSDGQAVSQGEVIGYVGSTGRSTGPHLHFETRIDGVARDPLPYLP